MRTRRLIVALTVSVSLLAAACQNSPTGTDSQPTPPPADTTTKRADQQPWT